MWDGYGKQRANYHYKLKDVQILQLDVSSANSNLQYSVLMVRFSLRSRPLWGLLVWPFGVIVGS